MIRMSKILIGEPEEKKTISLARGGRLEDNINCCLNKTGYQWWTGLTCLRLKPL
jgi:hypothetical protein